MTAPTTFDRATLEGVVDLVGSARRLALLVTARAGRDPSVCLVNVGLIDHPVTAEPVLAFVSRGRTAKLANLRRHPRAQLVFHSGWHWVAATGPVEIAGPDDALDGVEPGQLRQLLREIFHAAGGDHADLDEYDRIMAAERRAAVLLNPTRLASNPAGTNHEEPA